MRLLFRRIGGVAAIACESQTQASQLGYLFIIDTNMAAKSSLYMEHGGKGGDVVGNSSSGARFHEQVPTSSFSASRFVASSDNILFQDKSMLEPCAAIVERPEVSAGFSSKARTTTLDGDRNDNAQDMGTMNT